MVMVNLVGNKQQKKAAVTDVAYSMQHGHPFILEAQTP